MKKVELLSKDWLFCFTPLGTEVLPDDTNPDWSVVSVPHDWSIY